jgi:hypothetical protein
VLITSSSGITLSSGFDSVKNLEDTTFTNNPLDMEQLLESQLAQELYAG